MLFTTILSSLSLDLSLCILLPFVLSAILNRRRAFFPLFNGRVQLLRQKWRMRVLPACESLAKLRTWSFSTKMGNVFSNLLLDECFVFSNQSPREG